MHACMHTQHVQQAGRTAGLEEASVVGEVDSGAVLRRERRNKVGARVDVARLLPLPDVREEGLAVVGDVAGALRLHPHGL